MYAQTFRFVCLLFPFFCALSVVRSSVASPRPSAHDGQPDDKSDQYPLAGRIRSAQFTKSFFSSANSTGPLRLLPSPRAFSVRVCGKIGSVPNHSCRPESCERSHASPSVSYSTTHPARRWHTALGPTAGPSASHSKKSPTEHQHTTTPLSHTSAANKN